MMDHAKTAITILTNAIHQAGYIGCSRLTADFPLISLPAYHLTPHTLLQGNQHEILLMQMSYPSAALLEMKGNSVTLIISHHVHFTSGEIVFISDCKHAEMAEVKEVSSFHHLQKITLLNPLHYQYDRSAEVGKLEKNRYFVAKKNQTNLNNPPQFSLYVEDIRHHKTNLVEGIRQLELTYTLDQSQSQVIGVSIKLHLIFYPFQKTVYAYAALKR